MQRVVKNCFNEFLFGLVYWKAEMIFKLTTFFPDHHLNNIFLFHLNEFMFLFSKSGVQQLIHDLNLGFENHRDFEYFALVSKVYFHFCNFWNIIFFCSIGTPEIDSTDQQICLLELKVSQIWKSDHHSR